MIHITNTSSNYNNLFFLCLLVQRITAAHQITEEMYLLSWDLLFNLYITVAHQMRKNLSGLFSKVIKYYYFLQEVNEI